MKTSYAIFLSAIRAGARRLGWIQAAARLSILSHLEYRTNIAVDAILQPTLIAAVEVALWTGVFAGTGATAIGGFPRESYLAYALWAPFFARIGANWLYEARMSEEIETGSVNALLVRPITFYEFYLGQFLGYKGLTALLSIIPVTAFAFAVDGPTQLQRLPAALALAFYYLLLVHSLSFTIASLGFWLNNVHSITVAKNLALWLFTGELFPFDLVAEPLRSILLASPFASGAYWPVAFLVGRVGNADLAQAFASVTVGFVVVGILAMFAWSRGRKVYSGSGA